MLGSFEGALGSPELAIPLMKSAGLSSNEAAALLSSGFVAISKDILPVQFELLLVNAEPVDLLHRFADLDRFQRHSQSVGFNVVIADRYTGALFRPPKLTKAAVFGARGDSLDLSWLRGHQQTGRARFHEFPYFNVDSVNELAHICERLITHERETGSRILFRGQVKEYLLPRHPSVLEFLYGDSDIREPSLPSNAFRNKFNYIAAEPYLRLILRDVLYRRSDREDRHHWVETPNEQLNILSLGDRLRHALVDVMGISQHYGIPTYGIDATSSWETAFWFATHRYSSTNGKSRFDRMRWSGTDSTQWPIVYVLRTKNAADLSLMSFPSIRAKSQNAFFLPGSWGLHGNVAANDIICAIRLSPAAGADHHETSEIFPMPSSDPMYRELLEMKNRYRANPIAARIGLDYIFDLEYEAH